MIVTAIPFTSLVEANAFHTSRKTAGWSTATDADKLAALWRATDYIADTYTLTSGVTTADPALVRACATLAATALSEALTEPLLARDIISSSEAGDGLGSISTTYGERNEDRFPHITRILAPIATTDVGSTLVQGRIVL